MDKESAITAAARYANRRGVALVQVTVAGLLGTDEELTEIATSHWGPLTRSQLGHWYLLFNEENGHQHEFLVDDETGQVRWLNLPGWVQLLGWIAYSKYGAAILLGAIGVPLMVVGKLRGSEGMLVIGAMLAITACLTILRFGVRKH